ncbi:MAG: hypothetical protein IBX60_01675 [Candidatus Aminicenantes bacterium]|nr:hypothetical protein [Candidatus Aminicenantes bacterium]
MNSKIKSLIVFPLVLTLVLFSSCKRTAIEEPSPIGPSTFSVILNLSASPNVIFAGGVEYSREISTIKASLKKFDGMPLSDKTIHFEVRNTFGSKAYIGFFDENESIKTKITDQNGEATVQYYGPKAQELSDNETIYIYAIVSGDGKEYIIEKTPIYIIRDITEISFELYADPNVLWCTSKNPHSQIKAVCKKVNGIPLIGRKVFFTILSGMGHFSNGKTKYVAYTDEEGIAIATYVGPTKSEIGYDQWVTIRGQLETSDPDWLHKEVIIGLKIGD